MGYKWPENVEEKSLFVDAEGKVLKFADQTEVEVDAIFFALDISTTFRSWSLH
jgi:hypothetical protein